MGIMFKSKKRDLIVPQSEHAHLAGIIALLWGNDEFDLPDFDIDSFIMGVALHDIGHGHLDTHELGVMDDALSYKVDSALVNVKLPNPIADAVVHFHVLRLLKNYSHRPALVDLCEERILNDIKLSGISREEFIWSDRITEFCDFLSFYFCFDEPIERFCEVSPNRGNIKTISVRLKFDGDETVYIDPWPLKVDNYQGYILGYASKNYPDYLEPVLRKFVLLPG
jgi:Protein of unknown function (DUF3891)